MRSDEEKFEKVLSTLDVNVFELMDLTIETLGHQLIHESAVQTLKKKLSSIDPAIEESCTLSLDLFYPHN